MPAMKILRWSGGTHRISCGNYVPQILWHVNTAALLQHNSSSITKMVCMFTLHHVTYSNACLKYCSLVLRQTCFATTSGASARDHNLLPVCNKQANKQTNTKLTGLGFSFKFCGNNRPTDCNRLPIL